MTLARHTAPRLCVEQRILLRDVSWQTYERLLDEAGDSHIRMTYDTGTLELMSPSSEHERYSRLLLRLITSLAYEFDVPICSVGTTTWRRRGLKKGQEPDEAFYIEHEPQVRGKLHIDAEHDPPPDLVVEVDITHGSVDRLSIYAALGVGEVWRWDGQALTVFELTATGDYEQVDRSRSFPFLPIGQVTRALGQVQSEDENSIVRQFLQRVGQQRPDAHQ